MSYYDFIEYALLAVAVAATLIGSIGVLVTPDLYARLHYISLATSLGVVLLALAVAVQEVAQPSTGKAIIAALLVAFTGPLLNHATARAARTHRLGHWAGPENAPETAVSVEHEHKDADYAGQNPEHPLVEGV
jgi:multicomponent Na+:H+ antiporter subunit G